MGVLKSVEPTGFLAFAPAFAGINWADVYRRIIQNCPHGRGRALSSPRLFGSGFASLGRGSPPISTAATSAASGVSPRRWNTA